MQAVRFVNGAVHHQGGAALIGAHLGVGHRHGLFVFVVISQSVAIVEVSFQLLLAFAFDPPLPGGQDILNVDVGPRFVSGNIAVHKILHAVAGVEIGVKLRPADDGALRDEVCHADPAGSVVNPDVLTLVA